MKNKKAILMMVAMCVFAVGSAYGSNITIWDEWGTGTGWYGGGEDQEVENNCVTGQQWDLEGFFQSGDTLSMVAGYNFVSGVAGYNAASGDLFIDIDNDAQYGVGAHKPANYNPSQIVADTFGYDFVLDLDFASMTYSVIDIRTPGAQLLTTVNEQANDAANPWRYSSGGTVIGSGAIGYQSGLSNSQALALGYAVTGGSHNVASVDLGWLGGYMDAGDYFVSHFTMGCGNDDLMGRGSVVPEPTTLLLLGIGCLGAALRKRLSA